jgi:NADPH-dependent curcumin reductase
VHKRVYKNASEKARSAALDADFLRDMSTWVREGKVKHREFVTEGLDSAPEAFMGLLKGANFGKQLVRVGPDTA